MSRYIVGLGLVILVLFTYSVSRASKTLPPFTLTTLDSPSALLTGVHQTTGAFDINDRGEIVGSYDDANGGGHGFLFRDRTFITIDFPGGTFSGLVGINNQGVSVGGFIDADGKNQGFVLNRHGFHILRIPGITSPSPTGINDQG